jgi:hypothetical protein
MVSINTLEDPDINKACPQLVQFHEHVFNFLILNQEFTTCLVKANICHIKYHYCQISFRTLCCCGNIVRGETKQHLEENSDFNFTLVGPDIYLCLSPEQRNHRIFKRQCRVSGYKECALP